AAAAICATLGSAPGVWAQSRAVCSMIRYRVERPRSRVGSGGVRGLSVGTIELYVIQQAEEIVWHTRRARRGSGLMVGSESSRGRDGGAGAAAASAEVVVTGVGAIT